MTRTLTGLLRQDVLRTGDRFRNTLLWRRNVVRKHNFYNDPHTNTASDKPRGARAPPGVQDNSCSNPTTRVGLGSGTSMAREDPG